MITSAKEVIAAAILEALSSAIDGAAIYAKGDEVVIDGCFNMHSAATAILAALDAAGYVVTKVHERRAGMQIVHYGGLAYVVHPDIPLHVWDGKTMDRVTAGAQESKLSAEE